MTYIHDYMGLLGCLLLMVAAPLTIFKQPRVHRKTVTIIIFLMMGLAILPVNNLTLLTYIRAVIADLSITSMVMLCLMIASAYTGKRYLSNSTLQHLENTLLVAAILLYPLALGLTPIDSYATGYGSLVLYASLLVFSMHLLWRETYFTLSLLLTAVIAYLLNMLQSNNLWDYLLDPWIIFFALGHKIKTLFNQLAKDGE